MRFFFFGLLRDRDVLELVLARTVADQPLGRARLPGHKLVTLRGDTSPVLVPDPGSAVEGLLVDWLSAADLDRIHFYESVEYEPTTVEVERADGTRVPARAFVGSVRAAADEAEEWRLEDWRARHKAEDLREGALWMALYGHLSVEEADRLWDEALAEGRALEDFVAAVRTRTVGASG